MDISIHMSYRVLNKKDYTADVSFILQMELFDF